MLRGTFCSLAVLILFAVGPAKADDPKNKSGHDKNHDKATIASVDSAKNTVTVTMKDQVGKKVEKTFQLAEGAEYLDSSGQPRSLMPSTQETTS